MSGFNENKTLSPKTNSSISPVTPNIFESIGLTNIALASPSSIAQAQSFLNQLLFNNSYQSLLQSQNIYNANNFYNSNFSALCPQFFAKQNFSPNPYTSNFQLDKTTTTTNKESISNNQKNLERLNYLNNLITNSSQGSNLELEKALIYEHRLFLLLKFMFEKCELATLNPDVLKTDKQGSKNATNDINVMQPGFDFELKKFLMENEHKLMDQSLDNLIKNTQNAHIKQVYSSVNELVSLKMVQC